MCPAKTSFGVHRKYKRGEKLGRGVRICYFGVRICYFGELICYFGIRICYFGELICYFGELICYFGERICYFGELICYFGIRICYFGERICLSFSIYRELVITQYGSVSPKNHKLRRLGGGTKPNIFADLLGFTTFHSTYDYP